MANVISEMYCKFNPEFVWKLFSKSFRSIGVDIVFYFSNFISKDSIWTKLEKLKWKANLEQKTIFSIYLLVTSHIAGNWL